MRSLLKLTTLLFAFLSASLWEGEGDGDGDGDGAGDDGGDGVEPLPIEYADLTMCAIGANADTTGVVPEDGQSATEAIAAFIQENVAQRASGELVWLGPVHDAVQQPSTNASAEGTGESEGEGESSSQPDAPKHTATQKAVLHGNPRIPRHINTRLMNPSAGLTSVQQYSPDKLYNKEFYDDLRRELSEVPPGELRAALGARTESAQDSGEFARMKELQMSGDLVGI